MSLKRLECIAVSCFSDRFETDETFVVLPFSFFFKLFVMLNTKILFEVFATIIVGFGVPMNLK